MEEIPPGTTRFFCPGEKPVILANWQGEIHALSGICPHKNNPFDGATLWENLLDCPWHHFQYDVRSGENHFPKNVYPPDYRGLRSQLTPLKKYPVEVREGEIWVDLQ